MWLSHHSRCKEVDFGKKKPGFRPAQTGEEPVHDILLAPNGLHGRGPAPTPHVELLCGSRFLLDNDFEVGSNVLVQLNRNGELAQGLERLVQLDLAPVHVKALLCQSFS